MKLMKQTELPRTPVVITQHAREQLHKRMPKRMKDRIFGDVETYVKNMVKYSELIGLPRLDVEKDTGARSVTYSVTDQVMVYVLKKDLNNPGGPVFMTTALPHAWYGRRGEIGR